MIHGRRAGVGAESPVELAPELLDGLLRHRDLLGAHRKGHAGDLALGQGSFEALLRLSHHLQVKPAEPQVGRLVRRRETSFGLLEGGVLVEPEEPERAKVLDPAAGLGYRVTSTSPAVKAIQVYAPTDQAFVVVEPQFNLADPFGAQWGETDTGMVRLPPGGTVAYEARLEAFTIGT